MRVLYISHFDGLGGAERSLLDLMSLIDGAGVEPALLCPRGALSQAAAAADIAVITSGVQPLTRLRGRGAWRRTLPALMAGWSALDRALRDLRPHIVHANSAQAMLWAGPVARWHGCRVVWHWRDFYDFPAIVRLLAPGAHAIVVISRAMRRFADALLDTAGHRVVTIRNGIADLPGSSPHESASWRRALGIAADTPLIVAAGQSVPRKGHAVLLRALMHLSTTHPDARAWLICDELYPEASAHTRRLKRMATEFGCHRSVQITRGVERIAPVLRAADLVAVPSLREPFGRIAVEAMLAERPVVASDVDGLKEIVADRETGLLVRSGDPIDLSAGLARILDDPVAWRRKARAARQRALQHFSISRVVDELASLYREVLDD